MVCTNSEANEIVEVLHMNNIPAIIVGGYGYDNITNIFYFHKDIDIYVFSISYRKRVRYIMNVYNYRLVKEYYNRDVFIKYDCPVDVFYDSIAGYYPTTSPNAKYINRDDFIKMMNYHISISLDNKFKHKAIERIDNIIKHTLIV